MKEVLIQEYNSTKILNIPYKEPQNIFNVNFVDGAFLEITGPEDKEYKVLFINQDNDQFYIVPLLKIIYGLVLI